MSMPKMKVDYLPGEQQKELSDFRTESFDSADKLNAEAMRGSDDSYKLLSGDQFDQGLGYSNNALRNVIDRRAMEKYQMGMNRLKTENSLDAVNRKFNRLSQAAALTGAELAYNEKVRQMKYMEKMHRKQARGAALGNILGVAGAVVGGVVTMSPQGAMAGYAIGQGVGQYAGSQGG